MKALQYGGAGASYFSDINFGLILITSSLSFLQLHFPHLPIVIFFFSSLHAHLPRPQRFRQTPCQTRRPPAICLFWGVSPTPVITSHTHGTISRRRRWCWFLAASRSFRWRRRRRFGFCGRSARSGSIDAVGGCRGRWCGDGAGDGLGWSRWWNRFGSVFREVGRGDPALRGPVELLGEPPTWEHC